MNTKLTNILLIILLIFNVAFVGRWWMMGHHKPHHPMKEPKQETTIILHDRNKGEMFLVSTLGLDSLQQKKLDPILESHFNFLDKYMSAYIRNQSNFFNALKNNQDSTTAFRCADSLGLLKVAMERELYLHFLSIKNICNSGQQKQFNELIDNMSREFVHHHDIHSSEKSNQDSL
jgi:hypothetical protein